MAVRITQDRAQAIQAAIRQMTTDKVMVGIPRETSDRDDGELNNATRGFVHEYGAPEQNIPARPFLMPGIRDAEEAIVKQLRAGAKKTLTGDLSAANAALVGAGLKAVEGVVEKITNGPFVPLAPMTLEKRKARGHLGESPLIDFGEMRRAVTYAIRRSRQ